MESDNEKAMKKLREARDVALQAAVDAQDKLANELKTNKIKLQTDLDIAVSEREALKQELKEIKAELELFKNRKDVENDLSASIGTEDDGPAYTSNTVMVQLKGEGSYSISWFRSAAGSHFIPIPGAQAFGKIYTPTADDLGCTLRAQCYHKQSGATIAAEIGPVLPHPQLVEQLLELLKKSEIDFNVTNPDNVVDPKRPNETSDKRQLCINKKRVKFQKLHKTLMKENLTEHCRITLQPHSLTKFNLFLDTRKIAMSCEASSPMERDLIACTMRLLVYQVCYAKDAIPEKLRPQTHSLLYQLNLINIPSSSPIVYSGNSKLIKEVSIYVISSYYMYIYFGSVNVMYHIFTYLK